MVRGETGEIMADISITLKGKFDHDEVREIVNLMLATSFSSGDKIHIYMTGRRAKLNNYFFRVLAKAIANSGITLAEGVLGTKQSEFLTSVFDGSATSTSGITYSDLDDSLWLCDSDAQKIYNTELDGTLKSSFPISDFSGPFDIRGIAVDSDDNLWVIDPSPGKILKIDNTGTLLDSFLTDIIKDSIVPLSIAYDSTNNSLWLTDGTGKRIYNIDFNGVIKNQLDHSGFTSDASVVIVGMSARNNQLQLISSTATLKIFTTNKNGIGITSFDTSVYDGAATNPEGIAMAPDGTHFITDVQTNKIYNVAGTDINTLLNNGVIVIHSDNGFNKRINN